jgi:hypothetical protein
MGYILSVTWLLSCHLVVVWVISAETRISGMARMRSCCETDSYGLGLQFGEAAYINIRSSPNGASAVVDVRNLFSKLNEA